MTTLATLGIELGQSGTRAQFSDQVSTSGRFSVGYWESPTQTPTPTPSAWVPATLDIKPESLNETSKGNPVLAFVTLLADYDVADVVVSSIHLCLGSEPCGTTGVPAQIQGGAVGDQVEGELKSQGRNIRLKIVFDRQAVIAILQEAGPVDSVVMTVSGLIDPPGQLFAGSDEVKLIGPDGAPLPALRMSPVVTQTPTPGVPSATGTITPVVTSTGTPTVTRTPAATSFPTETPATVPSSTPTRAATAVAAAVQTSTAVPTATFTITPTVAPTYTPTPSPSPTPRPTWTPTATPTSIPTKAPTLTPTATGS